MRKIRVRALFIMAIIAVVALTTACGGAKDNVQSGSQDTGQEEIQPVRVITDAAFPPFENMENGVIVGFDVDLLAAVMEEAGLEYELNNSGWDALLIRTQEGKDVDMAISAVTINEDRQQSNDFSNPYFKSTHMIVFNEGMDIKNANDLIGKKVGVQIATTGAEAAQKVMGEKSTDILNYDTTVLAMMALKSGSVEAVVTDNTVAEEYLKNNPNDNFVAITDEENFEAEFYGILMPKGSPYKEQVDAGLKAMMENGKYAEIYEEWFGFQPDIDELLN